MLFSASSSPRRLALLAVLVFFCTLVLFRNSEYSQSVRSYSWKGASSQGDAVPPGSAKSSLDFDEIQEPLHQDAEKATSDSSNSHKKKPHHGHATNAGGIPAPKPMDYMVGDKKPIKHLRYEDQQKFVKELAEWETLDTANHWPSWDAYEDSGYDPNRWEGFDWELDMFTKNGINQIPENERKSAAYLPYPRYNTEEWKQYNKGEWKACQGPRGNNLDESLDDMVMAYRMPAPNFPEPMVGSAKVVGLDENVCFDRFGRYGAYGFAQTDSNVPKDWKRPDGKPDWTSKYWGQLQDACLQRNKERFHPDARAPMNLIPTNVFPKDGDTLNESVAVTGAYPKHQTRTALLIRTWEGYTYTDNDIQTIRALVTELSLLSGGEYQVYLYVNVKQKDADIYNDPQVYKDILHQVVPKELRDISVLWTEKVCEEWYPHVGDWQVYWQQFMPLQYFSKIHPEFDYVWNWETDARYTGNHFHFLEKMTEFARNMPRKNLWERNSRFYFPKVHGNFASFLADTDAAIANATAEGKMTPVWGPQPYDRDQVVFGDDPPTEYNVDEFQWGAGEEADLITLQPIWDPTQTEWSYRYKIWNFIKGKRPNFTPSDPGDDAYFHPDFAKIPRRTFINTVARFSKKMLHAMHMENRAGRSMQAEMWPATVALQHGLKAVYAPHPIWADRKWPSWFLEATFNADGGEAAAWGQRKDSPYNHDREAAFRGWSWYYSTGFPRILYRRFLGWKAKDVLGDLGGSALEEKETDTPELAAGVTDKKFGGHGRLCYPGMLLHPVKKMKEDDGLSIELARATDMDRRKEGGIATEVERITDVRGFYW